MAREYFQGTVKSGSREIPWASVFPKTLGFDCVRCGFCCYSRIGLTSADLKDFEKNGMDEFVDPVKRPSPNTPFDRVMKKRPDTACICMKDNLCSVYPKRPMVCRCFPFLLVVGFDNDASMDVVLRCPYVDISGSSRSKVDQKLLDSVASEYVKNVFPLMANTMDYKYTLARHIRSVVPAAFFPSGRRLSFMDKAIDLLKFENPQDLVGTMKNWSQSIANASHVIIMSNITEYEQMPSDGELLEGVSYSPGKAGLNKKRMKTIPSDFNNVFMHPSEKGIGLSDFYNSLFGIRFATGPAKVKKTASFKSLAGLAYTKDSIELFKEYLRLMVRRQSFQYCVARCADFLTDYARLGVVDFELEAAILANAMASNLDPLARAVAAVNERGEIDAQSLRFAISNIDSGLIANLVNDVVSGEMVKTVMRDTTGRRKSADF